MKQPLGFIFLFMMTFSALGQVANADDSLWMLEEVRIVDRRLSQFTSGDVLPIILQAISSVEHHHLATLPVQHLPINVHSYGPTNLSTAILTTIFLFKNN